MKHTSIHQTTLRGDETYGPGETSKQPLLGLKRGELRVSPYREEWKNLFESSHTKKPPNPPLLRTAHTTPQSDSLPPTPTTASPYRADTYRAATAHK